MTTLSFDCELLAEHLEAYLDRTIPAAEADAFEAHLECCEACRKSVHYSRAVRGLIDYVEARPAAPAASIVSEPARESILSRFGAAPWWFVSAALHVLAVALAGLVSMAIDMPQNDDSVVMITELQPRTEIKDEQTQAPKPALQDVLSKPETPPTDLNSKEVSDINVPPDILARAEPGDHFETENFDRPDTHGAYGNDASHSFHSIEGNAEPEGGGGMGGLGTDDLIGYGGTASKGTGGGFGGGNGPGIGTGEGGGKGSFGHRSDAGRRLMVRKHGGTKASESAVDRGLEWLAYHQEPDGHWDCQKNGAPVMPAGGYHGPDCVNTGMTGLALLAFLGAGNTEKVGKYKENVIRAIGWLKAKQDKNGAYCPYNYGHQMAAMAMAEASGMARVQETMESAQKAVQCTCAVHKNYATSERWGWSYLPEQIETNSAPGHGDMSNSGWAFMFLKSAKVAHLKVPTEALDGAITFMNACERDKVAGDPYSGHRYDYAVGPTYLNSKHAGYIAILGRLFFGTPANEVEDGAKYMVGRWGYPAHNAGQYDMYYYYYMTLISFQVGGDLWKNWNQHLLDTLPPEQNKGGADDGAWEPKGRHAEHWGRVGQTALSVLCLEVYYRYQKLAGNGN